MGSKASRPVWFRLWRLRNVGTRLDSFGRVVGLFFQQELFFSKGTVMKKMQSTLGILLAGLFFSTATHAITLCDNFGKTWDLTITNDSLVGKRDTTNALGCGGLYVRGMFGNSFGGTHFVVTSMEGNGSCVAVIWDGTWSGTSGSGTWYNSNGTGTGSFTLTSAACDVPVGNIGTDPSR